MTAAADICERELRGVDGLAHSLASLAGERATVLLFVGTNCPTARAYRERLHDLDAQYRDEGVRMVAINSNNPFLSPSDTYEEMVRRAPDLGYAFAYLKDEDGSVAQHYGAICTPHAFLLDADLRLVYDGRIANSRLGNRITSRDLEDAIAAVVAGETVPAAHTDPFGCAIVW